MIIIFRFYLGMPIATLHPGGQNLATGMWTAAAGASAQARNLDVVANNLANTDTPAFKKDLPTFKEYLGNVEREHLAAEIPRSPMKDKDFYPLDGRDQSYVVMDGTHTSHRQGGLRVTQEQLDLAMEGPGFLEVDTPAGIRYTRYGSLKLSPTGQLVTAEGFSVLSDQPLGLGVISSESSSGGNPLARGIQLRDRGSNLTISEEGEVFSGDEFIAKLSVVEFQDLKKLKKTGAHLFESLDSKNKREPLHTQVRQGLLETSNVNPIEEMTNMIRANRLFEQDMKSLKTFSEMMGREANDVGKL